MQPWGCFVLCMENRLVLWWCGGRGCGGVGGVCGRVVNGVFGEVPPIPIAIVTMPLLPPLRGVHPVVYHCFSVVSMVCLADVPLV
jgi:hypothetical protein